jgi:hypothetical protein
MVTYIVALFAVLFFVDTVAGGFLGIVGLLYGAFLMGIIEHRTAMIWSEVAMVAGLVFSAFVGPSGGNFDEKHSGTGGRYGSSGPDNAGGLVASAYLAKSTKSD